MRFALLLTLFLSVASIGGAAQQWQNHIDPNTGFYPDRQPQLSYRQDDGTFIITSGESGKFKLEITRPGRQAVRVDLPDDVAQINGIDPAPGNKAVVIGMGSSAVDTVEIVDTLNPHILDHFWAYDATLSPDGQFISFIKFFPPHFVEGPTDHVMVYDVTRSASENRPAGIELDDQINVGRAVYPANIQTTDSNVGVPESEVTRVSLDMFFWAPDSSTFIFPAAFRTQMDLVMVTPSHDKSGVKTFRVMTCENSCVYHLDGVDFGEDGIKAQFQGMKQPLQVRYDQFH